MRTRRLIGIVALLSVLLHAVAIARHNGLMLSALLQHQGLVADLKAICHGAGTPIKTELPYIPGPAGVDYDCPVCSGLVNAFALAATEQSAVPRPLPEVQDLSGLRRVIPRAERQALPPARGPPALG